MATLSLGKLIGGDPVSLKALEKGLEVDGWVFVNLESSFTEQISQIAPQLLHFFNNTSMPEKFKHTENVVGGIETDGPVYGYNSDAPRKEGIRLLTNSRLSSRWLPKSCPSLSSFSETMHQAMFDLVSSISPHLFSCSAEEVGAKWEVPMLRGKGNPKGDKNGPGEGRFGMFDVAYYFNSPLFKLPNCKEHSDPGLLSLSVASTERGLQLFRRRTGEWVDAPTGVGNSKAVLWGGTLIETITNGRLKSGIHRVINYPESPPRMSMWIECVTENQDLALMAPLLSQQPADPETDSMMEVTNESAIPEESPSFSFGSNNLDLTVANSHQSGIPMSKSDPADIFEFQLQQQPAKTKKSNYNKLKVLMAGSHESGIPMSKSGLPMSIQPVQQPAKTKKSSNQLDVSVSNSRRSGVPMSKSGLPPPSFQQQQQQQPIKTKKDNNNQLSMMMRDSHATGVPMSKSAPPPPSFHKQLSEPKKTPTQLDSMVSNSRRSGIPMSKSKRPSKKPQPQLQLQQQQQQQPVKLPKTPIPGMPGQFKKNCTQQQFREMGEHVKHCNHPTCYTVWNGMWGPFIGGRDGDVNFALSFCPQSRWMNEVIGWNYDDPSC